MDSQHITSIKRIASEVRAYFLQKTPFRIFHGSTNSTRILSFKRSEMIDVSDLNRVLSINTEKLTAVVEPNVPMDKLVAETLRYGLVPVVVMEFPGITVGGGIQGGAGESSSFRHGCFNQTCNWYEMILADGSIVKTSPKERADLFYGTAGTFGSLGIITAAEVRLVPAKRYVQLTYFPVTSFQNAVDTMREKIAEDSWDYIDGIMFGPDHGVIVTGNQSDEVEGKLVRFTRAQDPWHYLRAEAIDRQQRVVTETTPLVDYLFRYDRGGFWVGKLAFAIFGIPFNAFFRWLLSPITHTRKLYQALQESGVSQQYIIQDLAIPEEQAATFMSFIDKQFGIYPLWLCALKPDSKSPFQSNNIKSKLGINVGVWGGRFESYDEFLKANRAIEQKVKDLGGKKWFYAHSYYPEKEFWELYDKKAYDALRHKYHAETLPTIYDKVQVKDRYTVNYKRGALHALFFRRSKLRISD